MTEQVNQNLFFDMPDQLTAPADEAGKICEAPSEAGKIDELPTAPKKKQFRNDKVVCECGNKITSQSLMIGGEAVCDRCWNFDSIRVRLEQKRALKKGDELEASTDWYILHIPRNINRN